jgi:hypothetical protein
VENTREIQEEDRLSIVHNMNKITSKFIACVCFSLLCVNTCVLGVAIKSTNTFCIHTSALLLQNCTAGIKVCVRENCFVCFDRDGQ